MKLQEISGKNDIKNKIKEFISWAKSKLGIREKVNVALTNDFNRVKANRTFGTTMSDGKIWVYVGNRNTADILRTLCHELVHFRQFQKGTAHTNMDEKQRQKIEDEANAIAGRLMRDYGKLHVEIYEGRTGTLQPDVAAALPATYAIPELKNQDPYLQYRFGVAMAGAKGRKQREKDGVGSFSKESPWGENEIVVSFDPHIDEYIDDALAQMGLRGKKLISTRKSEEADDVSTKSPVSGFRGYN